MKIQLIISFILIYIFVTSANKIYKVDISESPQEYWNRIYNDGDNYKTITGFVTYINRLMRSLKTDEIVNYIEGEFKTEYFDQEFIENVEAASTILKQPFADVAIFNFIYEYFAACTSLITQDENGHIIHGRNLDYGFQQYTIPLAAQVEFYDKDKLIYTASYILGLAGCNAGMRNQQFGLSLNQRRAHNDKYFRKNFLKIIKEKKSNVPFFVKKCLQHANTFAEALEILTTSEIDLTAYFILSGIQSNEGVVIERDPTQIHGIYGINIETGKWYIVQTNYDRDVPDPSSDYRRIPAEKKIQELGQLKVSEINLRENILSQAPNKYGITILSLVMSAQTGYFNQHVYYDNKDLNTSPFDLPFHKVSSEER